MPQVQEHPARYVRALSSGELVKAALQMYARNFWTLFLIPITALVGGLVAAIAVIGLGYWMGGDELAIILAIPVYLGFYFLLFVASAAQTVAISEISLGHRPSFTRAYRRVMDATAAKLLATSLLQILALFAGFLFFVIPGLILMMWFLLTSPVVVLEDRWGRDALRRSRELGRGHYLRMFGTYVVFIIAVLAVIMAISVPILIFSELGIVVMYGLELLILPVLTIVLVLMYYDLRVRKEGYDIAALSEGLQH